MIQNHLRVVQVNVALKLVLQEGLLVLLLLLVPFCKPLPLATSLPAVDFAKALACVHKRPLFGLICTRFLLVVDLDLLLSSLVRDHIVAVDTLVQFLAALAGIARAAILTLNHLNLIRVHVLKRRFFAHLKFFLT